MNKLKQRVLVLVIGIVFVVSIFGCEQQGLSNAKRSRLMVVENRQLKKQLELYEKQLELRDGEIERQKEQLEYYQQQKRQFGEKSQADIQDLIDAAFKNIAEENAKLRQEVNVLKDRIKKLEQKLRELKNPSGPTPL